MLFNYAYKIYKTNLNLPVLGCCHKIIKGNHIFKQVSKKPSTIGNKNQPDNQLVTLRIGEEILTSC